MNETHFARRTFLKGTALAVAGLSAPRLLAAGSPESIGGDRPLIKPVHDAIVCPWTPEHPRHDHQLIFPLDDQRLLLVWSEYYTAGADPAAKKGSFVYRLLVRDPQGKLTAHTVDARAPFGR